MAATLTFGDVLDAVHEWPLENQEELVAVVQGRIAEAKRRRVVEDVAAARAEFDRGECRAQSVDEIMAQLER